MIATDIQLPDGALENLARAELENFVELELLTAGELESAIAIRYNPGHW